MTRTGYTIDACTDCLMAAAGYGPEDTGHTPDVEPLSSIAPGVEVTPGCVDCPPCEHPDCGPAPVCGCGYADAGHGFSWAPCGACGSTLGGDRHPLTLWDPAEVPA